MGKFLNDLLHGKRVVQKLQFLGQKHVPCKKKLLVL